MKNLIIFLCLLFNVQTTIAQIDCSIVDDESEQSSKTGCNSVSIPNEMFVKALPKVEVKVFFHFQAKQNGVNFSDELPGVLPWSVTNGYNFASGILQSMNNRTVKWVDIAYTNPHTTLNEDLLDSNIDFVWANSSNENSVAFYDFTDDIENQDNALNIVFLGTENPGGNGGYPTSGFTLGYHVDEVFLRNAQRRVIEQADQPYPVSQWAAVTLHEIGHSMNLRHSFNSTNVCNGQDLDCMIEVCGQQCHNNDFNNGPNPWGCSELTMGYGVQNRLTLCELTVLWQEFLDYNKIYRSTQCQPQIDKFVNLDSGGTIIWDERVVLDANLRILNNTELIITCDVLMGEAREIIVEPGSRIFVDGGSITNLCTEPWKGIKVRNGFDGFAVEMSKAIIENTSEAAVSMFASGGWLLGSGNAEVKIENSTFNNCKRMLALGAPSSSLNNSIISNNVQNGGKHGITNWNCRGVQVTDNTFNNITNECIVTEHGQFTIERNTFNSGRADILFANTNPGFGTDIWTNQFNGSNTGIRALGASLGQHSIRTNQFFTGEFDAFMDGDNNYRIEDNDFTSDFAITSISNGLHSNDVRRNNITGNFIGLLPTGDNRNYLFYDNCFNTSFTDSWIEGQVNDPQAHGENLGAANNCFSHAGNINDPTFDMTGNPLPFIYTVPNDTQIDCRDAEKAHSNISLKEEPSEASPCGNVGTGIGGYPPSTQFNPCNPQKVLTPTWDAVSWLENKLQEIASNPNLTPAQKAYYTDIYERCLQRVKWQLVQLLIEADLFNDARTFLATESSTDALLAIYSTYILEDNLQGARQYINSLTSTDVALVDFISVQHINLNRLDNGRVYTPTASELQLVETIANKTHPYAGYAKALYYWLTGDILVSDIPDFTAHGLPRSDFDNDNSSKVEANIYPNPFQNQLNIDIESGVEVGLEITDLFGIVFTSQSIDKFTTINTSSWSSGVYVISIWYDDQKIQQEKIVLTR